MTAPRADRNDPERLLAHDPFVRGLARQLLADAHAADDLVQETWVAALQRPPTALSLRGWLAAVVRRLASRQRRTERRLTERHEAVARPEGVPSAAEIVAREGMRAEVVRAVLDLDEPYRAAVLLRFFENLPPRAIARRLGVPVETVRTRLKRASAVLRARLDAHREGGRGAWCALLLPFAGRPSPLAAATAAAGTILPGVLLMSAKTKLSALAAALGGLLLVALWVLPQRSGSADPPPPITPANATTLTAAAPATGPDSAAVPAGAAPATGREAVTPPATPAKGSLRVRVVWGDDQQPAAGVLVELNRLTGDDLLEGVRAATDAQGEVLHADLQPGRVYARAVRRGLGNWSRAEVEAGKEAEMTVTLAVGMNVRGAVVDGRGQPVSGAEVLVAEWAGGEALPMARTTDDGTFALRAVDTHCHIGARAEGFAPSLLRQFTASKGADVELRLVLAAPGFTLGGTVLGPDRAPVAGAIVQLGVHDRAGMQKQPDGAWAKLPMPARARSDAAGRFAFHSAAAGTQPLAVRARGLAPWQGTVEILPGSNRDLIVELQPGVTVHGTVRDEAGAAVAKAAIALDHPDEFQRRYLRTGADGAFRLDGLPAGELRLRADHDEQGKASTTLTARAGDTLPWEPVLARGLIFRGRVLDADGKPVARAMVEARLEQWSRDVSWHGFQNTDADGRFTLSNCIAGQPIVLTVRRKSFPEVQEHGLVPGGSEHVVRLPKEAWVRIRGRVLDPDGKALPNVHVMPSTKGGGGSPAETTEAGTGAFDLGPYPPGEYSLRLQAEGYPVIRLGRVLGPDEFWDLGTLRFERGGTLHVSLRAPDGDPDPPFSLSLHEVDGEWLDNLDVAAGEARSGPLAAGRYVLQLQSDRVACAQQAFEIRPDIETRLEVALARGVATAIEFERPAPARGGVAVVIRDATGAGVLRTSAWTRAGVTRLDVVLAPGSYTIDATSDAATGTGALDVTAPGPAAAKIRLRPR